MHIYNCQYKIKEMQQPYHELFATSCMPHLLKKTFTPSPQQLQLAKQSLIHKHKVSNGIQQLLFCRQGTSQQDDLVSVGERKMVETERKKYMDFVRKNYNQTISEELTTVNKLRTKIKEHQNRDEAERRRAFDEKNGKNLAQQEVGRRRRMEEPKAGKKKVKADETSKTKKDPKSKQKKEGMKQEPPLRPPTPPERIDEPYQSQDELPSESLQLDLLNSLDEDDLDNYQNDQE